MLPIKHLTLMATFLVAGCATLPTDDTPDGPKPDDIGYIIPNPDGSDPQIHHSSRSGVEGVFEEGVFFCRNALTHVQRRRGFQRGEELRIHAAEFGFGTGPEDSVKLRQYVGSGPLAVFAGREDTRILVALNYQTEICHTLAFDAPNADAGHRRILDLNITSAEEMPNSYGLYSEAQTFGRWCYREANMFSDSGKELILSGGGQSPSGLTAAAQYQATAECAPKTG